MLIAARVCRVNFKVRFTLSLLDPQYDFSLILLFYIYIRTMLKFPSIMIRKIMTSNSFPTEQREAGPMLFT